MVTRPTVVMGWNMSGRMLAEAPRTSHDSPCSFFPLVRATSNMTAQASQSGRPQQTHKGHLTCKKQTVGVLSPCNIRAAVTRRIFQLISNDTGSSLHFSFSSALTPLLPSLSLNKYFLRSTRHNHQDKVPILIKSIFQCEEMELNQMEEQKV